MQTFTIPALFLLPLIGSLLCFGFSVQARGSARSSSVVPGFIAGTVTTLSFLNVLNLYLSGWTGSGSLFPYWITVDNFSVGFDYAIDHLTVTLLLIITGIGSLIQWYSTAYMKHDAGKARFFGYMCLFIFFMTVLVLGANLPVMFIGWEGVGLCSYLLIGFWFSKIDYCRAGLKAFVVNRIGDAGFIIAMIALYSMYRTLDIQALNTLIAKQGTVSLELSIAVLGLLFAISAKSAQMPLFTWLPDAMAGPTPVSALIHAATMVTAGVYLLARMDFLFEARAGIMAMVLIIACLTALMAALVACVQRDIKKVLAYSTVSQLGFMVAAASAGLYGVAIFHVVTHAFFKACLFLCAGNVIHACDDEQDIAHYGGLWKKMPGTALCFGVSALALAGVVPFAGFYSKYLISHSIAHGGLAHSLLADVGMRTALVSQLFLVIEWVLIVCSLLTAYYSARLFCLVFLGQYRGQAHPHEAPFLMLIPVAVLAVGSVVAGILFLDTPYYLAIETPVIGHVAKSWSDFVSMGDVGAVLMKSAVAFIGIGWALAIYLSRGPAALLRTAGPTLFFAPLSRAKFYWDEVYGWLFVRPFNYLSSLFNRFVEPFVVCGLFDGLWVSSVALGESGRAVQTGQVRHYALQIFGALILMIFFYMVL